MSVFLFYYYELTMIHVYKLYHGGLKIKLLTFFFFLGGGGRGRRKEVLYTYMYVCMHAHVLLSFLNLWANMMKLKVLK